MSPEYHIQIIGVDSPFDLPKLRTCYLRLVREHHPDQFFSDTTKYAIATEKTKQLNLSFQFLSELLEEVGGRYIAAPAAPSTEYQFRRAASSRPKYRYEEETYEAGFPDIAVTEIFLKSSHIISTGYDLRNRILYIEFKGHTVYQYSDVPLSVFEAFLDADSHGKFAHKNIYKTFRYEQC